MALARFVVNQRSRPPFSSSALLKQLHWLPLEWCRQFKLSRNCIQVAHTYLLQHHQPTRSLRSSSSHQLFIPRYNLSFGSCVYCFSAHRSGTLFAFVNPSHFLLLNAISRLTFSSKLTPRPLATHHPTRPESFIEFGAI